MSGPDTYWFRNNIYMHRLFFGGCNLPNFNFNIPVIICHKTVQRNVKTIKDISKHEKIWSTQIYCLAVLFVKTPLPLESMNSWLPWRREPEQTKRPEVAFRCSFLCTQSIWPNRDVSTVQWFLCSHLMHRKFLVSSFLRSTKVSIIIAIMSFSYFCELKFFIFFIECLGIAMRVKYVHQRQRRFQITLLSILERPLTFWMPKWLHHFFDLHVFVMNLFSADMAQFWYTYVTTVKMRAREDRNPSSEFLLDFSSTIKAVLHYVVLF